MTPNDGTQRGRDAEALLADLVARWREAERHWQKMASGRERSYGGHPLYEDGLAEAFGRCADIVTNEIAKKACDESSKCMARLSREERRALGEWALSVIYPDGHWSCRNHGDLIAYRVANGQRCPVCNSANGQGLHWTESEAANDVAAKRCIHGEPLNVFCGKCEK